MATSSRKQGHVNGQNVNSSNLSSHQSSSSSARSSKNVLTKRTGSLEIIEGNASGLYSPESGSRPPSQGSQRPWSRSSMGSVPPRPDSSLSRRIATPTKQISLQAVKRKEESSEPFLPDVDFAALNLDKSYSRAWNLGSFDDEDSSRVLTPKYDSESEVYAPQHATQLRLPRLHESEELADHRIDLDNDSQADSPVAGPSHSSLVAAASNSRRESDSAENTQTVPSTEHASQDQNEEDEDDDDDDEEDEEERKAPNELLMEFVECLMKKDYKNAEKLCKMILLYEPTNPEALKFQPVIEEKLKLDAETEANEDEEEDDEDDDDEEDDDEEDDNNDDDDDDSSSDDDDDDDSDEEDEESIFRVMAEAVAANYYVNQEPGQNGEPSRRRDSGIASDSEP